MRPQPPPEPEVPADLSLPAIPTHELSDWRALAPGQLAEFPDGQQAIVIAVDKNATVGPALTLLRVAGPRDTVTPLGEVYQLSDKAAAAVLPVRVIGAWYPSAAVPLPERIVLEAIRRGLITSRNCGVAWPLVSTWQLSEQAAAQIEKYLYEVARTTGCAFPFHEITTAMRSMHLRPSPEHPSLIDVVTGETVGRQPRSDDELLGVWARKLYENVHASDWGIPAFQPAMKD